MAVMRTLFATLVVCTLALLACADATPPPAAEPQPTTGEVIFNAQCAMCHGRKGDLGLNGAKDLTQSTLSKEEMVQVVTNGRNAMMPYKRILTPDQVNEVVDHALALRKKG